MPQLSVNELRNLLVALPKFPGAAFRSQALLTAPGRKKQRALPLRFESVHGAVLR